MYRIGVDVGGTNTDAVIMHGRRIIAGVKVPTSSDVTSGLFGALEKVLAEAEIAGTSIGLVVIGTTHFTNAVIERKHLEPTAVVRLCLPAAQSLPPMVDWPADLKAAVGNHTYLAHGGVEFDGQPISTFDPSEITRIGADIRARGVRAIAVTGVFAPVRDDFEREAAALLAAAVPDASITLSGSIGQLGFLEREGASILNSALLGLARRTVAALQAGVARCGLRCPVFLSQNDGTLMEASVAERFPVLTFAIDREGAQDGDPAVFLLRQCNRRQAGGSLRRSIGVDGFERRIGGDTVIPAGRAAIFETRATEDQMRHACVHRPAPQRQARLHVLGKELPCGCFLRTDTDRRQVHHCLAPGQGLGRIALEIPFDPDRLLGERNAGLRTGTPEGPHLMARGQRRLQEVGADESRAASDENPHTVAQSC